MNKPIFISYKRIDKDKVFKIKDYIESRTSYSCWIDLDDIKSDALFKHVIINAIRSCKVFLFMYSKAHSQITDFENEWTINELEFAKAKKKRIVFINVDGTELTDDFLFGNTSKHRVDAREDSSLDKLVLDLKKWIGLPARQEKIEARKKYRNSDKRIIQKKLNSTDKNKLSAMDSRKPNDLILKLYTEGCNYYYGTNEVDRDSKKAFSCFEEAAKLNHRQSQRMLSKMYFLGIGAKQDKIKGEYWLEQSKLPEGVVTMSNLPKSISFEHEGKHFHMVLSDDEKFYLGNLYAKDGDLSWLNNKWIQSIGAGALCAGAVSFGIIALPVAILVGFKALTAIFSNSDDNKEELTGIIVDASLCKKLNKNTGYCFSVPHESELFGVKEDMRKGCIVLRLSDNPRLSECL